MNSDDLIDQIISKGIDYDKNEITVESVLEDLINPGSNISNLVTPNKENKNEIKTGLDDNELDKILKEEKGKNNNIDIENLLKEDINIPKEINNDDIDKILKEKPKEISNDLLNEILNENKSEKQKEIEDEIKKEESKINKNVPKEKDEQNKEALKEIEKTMELLKKEREEELIKKELERKKEEEKIMKKEEDEKKRKEEEIKRKEKEKKRKEEEEKINKKKEEERKKLDSFIPQFPNPVDFVQYIEILRVNTKISGELQNFFLQNHQKKDNKYSITTLKLLSDINKKLSRDEISFIFSKRDFLIICNNKNEIFIFSIKSQKNIYKIIPKNMQNKEIKCLDITDDLLDIIVGYQDGTIAFINIRTSEVKYSTNKIHKETSCLEIKINKKEKENEIYFISSGADGQVFYSSFKKMIFWRYSSTLIIKNNIPFFMIKLANISPKNQYYYAKLYSLRKYVLLGSMEEIKLFCLEPKIEQILEIKKPDNIIGNIAPDAQIGIGRVPQIKMRFAKVDDRNHLLLIISWGNIIYFYQLSLDDETISNEFKEIGYYINLFDILRIGFLNSSAVFCIDKTYGIKILNSAKVNQGKINFSDDGKPIVPNKNDLAEIEKNRLICENIPSDKQFENKIETYLYSINDNDCSLQILGEKQIYDLNLIKWDLFLKELQKNNDYLNLFSVGIDLYNGKIAFFSELPDKRTIKKKIGDYLKEILSQYVNLILKEKKSNIKDKKEKEKIFECINIVIEVCIELEAVEFLLRTIEPLFEEKEYGDLFLERIEPFILCDKIIKYVLSSDIIINLIDLYNKKGKLESLSQILLHINIIAMDKPEIKKKLEETNLIIPLIYLYHNGKNEDYFAPLQKMFDYYNSKTSFNKILINEEDNSINYHDSINNNSITLKEIQDSKEYNGHRILWYIKWCLSGKKFPDNLIKMKDNLFEELVPKIAYWLLNNKVMDELLNFDPKNYFIIYKNILSIKSLYTKLVSSFKNEKIKNKLIEELSSEDFQIKEKEIKPILIVNYLVSWCKKKNKNIIFFYLYDFIIGISNNKEININKELRIESVSYIIKHYKQTIKKINNQQVESLIIIIINFLKDEMFNIDDYKQILPSVLDNIFDEVKLFLLEKIGNYRQCLELYIDKTSLIKNKNNEIYNWIDKIIHQTKKDTKPYEELLEAIKDNIFPLISISLNKFYYLSRQIFQNIRKDVIERLEKDKKLQLEFIELIIQSLIKKEFDIDEDTEEIKKILILHIELLCELNQFDKIVLAFQSCSLYPFEECLSCCEKAKAHEACIYLYLKEGSVEKAFNLSISKLNSIFELILDNINNENEENKKFNNLLEDLNKYLLSVIDICENNDKNIEDLWFKLLDKLYQYEDEAVKISKKYENDNKKKKKSDDLYQNLVENVKDLTEKMCSYVSIKRILEIVTDKNKISGFKEYKELIIKLLGIYSNSTDILFSVKRLFTSLIFQTDKQFNDFNTEGFTLNEICDKCSKEFNCDKIYRFNCKHFIHKECIFYQNCEFGKQMLCPICKDIEIENKNIDGKSLVKLNTNIIEENNIRENYVPPRISQKLKKFDKSVYERNKAMIRTNYNS